MPANITNTPLGMVATAVNLPVPVTQQESTAISTSAPQNPTQPVCNARRSQKFSDLILLLQESFHEE